MAERCRVKLCFDPPTLLQPRLRHQGLHQCWFLLPPGLATVGELASRLASEFRLRRSCPTGFVLQVDGFCLPAAQPLSLIRDGDTIWVQTKPSPRWPLGQVAAGHRPPVLLLTGVEPPEGKEAGRGKEAPPRGPLLAPHEFAGEAGGYESDDETEEDETEEDERNGRAVPAGDRRERVKEVQGTLGLAEDKPRGKLKKRKKTEGFREEGVEGNEKGRLQQGAKRRKGGEGVGGVLVVQTGGAGAGGAARDQEEAGKSKVVKAEGSGKKDGEGRKEEGKVKAKVQGLGPKGGDAAIGEGNEATEVERGKGGTALAIVKSVMDDLKSKKTGEVGRGAEGQEAANGKASAESAEKGKGNGKGKGKEKDADNMKIVKEKEVTKVKKWIETKTETGKVEKMKVETVVRVKKSRDAAGAIVEEGKEKLEGKDGEAEAGGPRKKRKALMSKQEGSAGSSKAKEQGKVKKEMSAADKTREGPDQSQQRKKVKKEVEKPKQVKTDSKETKQAEKTKKEKEEVDERKQVTKGSKKPKQADEQKSSKMPGERKGIKESSTKKEKKNAKEEVKMEASPQEAEARPMRGQSPGTPAVSAPAGKAEVESTPSKSPGGAKSEGASRSARRKKAKRVWLRKQAEGAGHAATSDASPEAASPLMFNRSVPAGTPAGPPSSGQVDRPGDGQGSRKRNGRSGPREEEPSPEGRLANGHIRFGEEGEEPVGATTPMPVVNLGQIGSKRRGQAWGQQKSFSGSQGRVGSKERSCFMPEAGQRIPPPETTKPARQLQLADYESLPPLLGPPKVGDLVAYRLVELTASWTPELSGFREGRVAAFDPSSNEVTITPSEATLAAILAEQGQVAAGEEGQEAGGEGEGGAAAEATYPPPYLEDGTLEADLFSLSDLRIVLSAPLQGLPAAAAEPLSVETGGDVSLVPPTPLNSPVSANLIPFPSFSDALARAFPQDTTPTDNTSPGSALPGRTMPGGTPLATAFPDSTSHETGNAVEALPRSHPTLSIAPFKAPELSLGGLASPMAQHFATPPNSPLGGPGTSSLSWAALQSALKGVEDGAGNSTGDAVPSDITLGTSPQADGDGTATRSQKKGRQAAGLVAGLDVGRDENGGRGAKEAAAQGQASRKGAKEHPVVGDASTWHQWAEIADLSREIEKRRAELESESPPSSSPVLDSRGKDDANAQLAPKQAKRKGTSQSPLNGKRGPSSSRTLRAAAIGPTLALLRAERQAEAAL